MSESEILTKAIDKAIAGGWKRPSNWIFRSKDEFEIHDIMLVDGGSHIFHVRELLYDHDFAKALWGEEPTYGIASNSRQRIAGEFLPWQFQLQQMVITNDPIKYLDEHLGVEEE